MCDHEAWWAYSEQWLVRVRTNQINQGPRSLGQLDEAQTCQAQSRGLWLCSVAVLVRHWPMARFGAFKESCDHLKVGKHFSVQQWLSLGLHHCLRSQSLSSEVGDTGY